MKNQRIDRENEWTKRPKSEVIRTYEYQDSIIIHAKTCKYMILQFREKNLYVMLNDKTFEDLTSI